MKCRDCCRREVYAVLSILTTCVFELIALAAPWYALAATALPSPWDTMTAVFYWTGMEALYSPPLINNMRSYNIAWSSMASTMPKDVYMASMAMCFLSIFSGIVLAAMIFFGMVFPRTERIVKMMVGTWYKWIVVAMSYLHFFFVLTAWTVFFAFPAGLKSANMCPGTPAYSPSPFPFSNQTIYFEPLWCDSFTNNRFTYGSTEWVWAPSVGWIFGLIATVPCLICLFIMLTIPTKGLRAAYTPIK